MSLAAKSSKVTESMKQMLSHTISQPLRWRWYHGATFYVVSQAITFGLSGLVSVITGNKGKDVRETFFGDVSYFKRLKQAKLLHLPGYLRLRGQSIISVRFMAVYVY